MKELFKNTPKAYISELPLAAFQGRIVVIDSLLEAKKAIAYLNTCPLLGIDTETRPAFKKGVFHKVALLQLSTLECCFLFRLNRIKMPTELIALLENEKVQKIGLSLKDDLYMLRNRAAFNPAGFVELQDFVKVFGVEDMSLQKLYANIFGQRISKSARLTNWEADVLTEAQKRYAALDAYACLQMYNELVALYESRDYTLKADEELSEQKP